jgi:predicted phosphodiesterase
MEPWPVTESDVESSPAASTPTAPVTPTRPKGTAAQRRGWRRLVPRRPRARTLAAALALVVLALGGATAGLLLAGSVSHQVGPVDVSFRLRLAGSGGTRVDVPPLGRLTMDSHDGPLRLDASVTQVRADAVRQLVENYPGSVDALGPRIERDVRSAVVSLVVRSGIAALAGGLLVVGLVFRRPKPILGGALATLVAISAVGGVTAATFRPQALAEPTFSGLLASAPAAFGDVRDIEQRFTAYRDEIAKLTTNVSKLYDATTTLPTLPPDADTIRVLWVADIHDNPEAFDVMRSVASQFEVDAIVDSGDISDHGTAIENNIYAPIRTLGAPYVYVKGNHDSLDETVPALAKMPNVVVLDGNVRTVAGLTFAGIGDPRFTPDKTRHYTTASDTQLLDETGSELADNIDVESPTADVAVIHDPVMAGPLYGHVPLILAGHTHQRAQAYRDGTLLLVQGSTGGAGLRGLEPTKPVPLDLSVLYFSRSTHRLVAYDDLTVGGLGLTSAQIERHRADRVIARAKQPAPAPTTTTSTPPTSPSTTPSGGASTSPSLEPSGSTSLSAP